MNRARFSALIPELEHSLDLAIGEHAYVRGILFREEPVQGFRASGEATVAGAMAAAATPASRRRVTLYRQQNLIGRVSP